MLRAAFALTFALSGLTGCNFDRLGSWGPISDRAGKPHSPVPHARSLEIQQTCKALKTPQSDLCRDMEKLDQKPAAHH